MSACAHLPVSVDSTDRVSLCFSFSDSTYLRTHDGLLECLRVGIIIFVYC